MDSAHPSAPAFKVATRDDGGGGTFFRLKLFSWSILARSQVIKRLITKDGLLIYHGEPEEGLPDEDRLIAVHPNYATS